MYDKEELIEVFVQQYEEGDKKISLAKYIANELKKVDKIIAALINRDKQIVKLTQKHELELKALQKDYDKIIHSCEHQLTKRHPDPAGGSDSWTECLICGKEL